MKKYIVILGIGLLFAACKKNYTCVCTTTVTENGASTTLTEPMPLDKMKKADAKKKCAEGNESNQENNTKVVTTCEIK